MFLVPDFSCLRQSFLQQILLQHNLLIHVVIVVPSLLKKVLKELELFLGHFSFIIVV